MYTVGLTGGIGSGKSAASAIFAKLGATVIDADVISHELVKPGQPALTKITQTFGEAFLDTQGQLNRSLLRQRIFDDPNQRLELEKIMHPLIRDTMWQQVKQSTTEYTILAVPLLYENQIHYPVNRILLIDVPETLQRERIKTRDQLDDQSITLIFASQSSRKQRLKIAHDVIENTGTLNELEKQVRQQHHQYRHLTGMKSTASKSFA